MEKDVDLDLLKKQWKKIKSEFKPFNDKWFGWNYNDQQIELITVLRDKNDFPLMGKFKSKEI